MCTHAIMTSLMAADSSWDSSSSVDSHFDLPDIPSVPHQPTNFALSKRCFGQTNVIYQSFQPLWFQHWPSQCCLLPYMCHRIQGKENTKSSCWYYNHQDWSWNCSQMPVQFSWRHAPGPPRFSCFTAVLFLANIVVIVNLTTISVLDLALIDIHPGFLNVHFSKRICTYVCMYISQNT